MLQFFAEPVVIQGRSSDTDLEAAKNIKSSPSAFKVSRLFNKRIIGTYAESLSAKLLEDGDKEEHLLIATESFTLENDMASFKIVFAFSDIDDVTGLDCLWLIRALSFCSNPERICIFIKSEARAPAKKAGAAFIEIVEKAFLPITYSDERAFARRYCEY